MTQNELFAYWNDSTHGRKWFHRIEISPGVFLPGTQDSADKRDRVGLPVDLTGKTVLDIGCNDGGHAFECEKRGAEVDAFDLEPEGARVLAEYMRSKVNIFEADVFTFEKRRRYDIVLFMGVLYHVKDMMACLKKVYDLADNLVILETHVNRLGDPQPMAIFYPGATLNNDPTNWWGPNVPCVIEMMKAVGFHGVELKNTWHDRACVWGYK